MSNRLILLTLSLQSEFTQERWERSPDKRGQPGWPRAGGHKRKTSLILLTNDAYRIARVELYCTSTIYLLDVHVMNGSE